MREKSLMWFILILLSLFHPFSVIAEDVIWDKQNHPDGVIILGSNQSPPNDFAGVYEFDNLTIGDDIKVLSHGISQLAIRVRGTLRLGSNAAIIVRNGFFPEAPLYPVATVTSASLVGWDNLNGMPLFPNTFGRGGEGERGQDGADGRVYERYPPPYYYGRGGHGGGGGAGGYGGGIGGNGGNGGRGKCYVVTGYCAPNGYPGLPGKCCGNAGGDSGSGESGGAGGGKDGVGESGSNGIPFCAGGGGGGGNSGAGGDGKTGGYDDQHAIGDGTGGRGGHGGGYGGGVLTIIADSIEYDNWAEPKFIVSGQRSKAVFGASQGEGGLLIIESPNYTPSGNHWRLDGDFAVNMNGHGTLKGNPQKVFLNGKDISSQNPIADAGPDQTVFEKETVELDGSGASDDASEEILSYSWRQVQGIAVSLSDPISTKPVFTAPLVEKEGGSLTFELTVTDNAGLISRSTCIVTVLSDIPAAQFSADSIQGFSPLTVTFSDESAGKVTAWEWDFGDGTTVSGTGEDQQNPQHTYTKPGRYTVRLTSFGPTGSNTLIKERLINVVDPVPVVDFSADTTNGKAWLTVKFTDKSTGDRINGWEWDFGDGTKSTEQNPSHTYKFAGTYSVTLTVAGIAGTRTYTKTNSITVQSFVLGISGYETISTKIWYPAGQQGFFNWDNRAILGPAESVYVASAYSNRYNPADPTMLIDKYAGNGISKSVVYKSSRSSIGAAGFDGLTVDMDGNVYVSADGKTLKYSADLDNSSQFGSGDYKVTIDEDFIYGVRTCDSCTLGEIRIEKYDRQGTLIWSKGMLGGYKNLRVQQPVITDGSGNIFIAASYSRNTSSKFDHILIKLDPNGSEAWKKTFPGVKDFLSPCSSTPESSMRTDGTGNLYFGASICTDTSYISTLYDYRITKYSPSGEAIGDDLNYQNAAHQYGGGSSFALDSEANLYVAVQLKDASAKLFKYTSDGIPLWERAIDIQLRSEWRPFSFKLDKEGNVYVSGRLDNDLVMARYSSVDGTQEWVMPLGTFTQWSYDSTNDVVIFGISEVRNIYTINDTSDGYEIRIYPQAQEITPDFSVDNRSGLPPLAVNFNGTSSGRAPEPNWQWHWDFGDGTSLTGQNPFHTYTSSGIYTVSLTVTGYLDNINQTITKTKKDFIIVGPQQTLSVSRSGSGQGSVKSDLPGIDCGSSCSHAYGIGEVVTLVPTPTEGSYFYGWSGDCSGSGECKVAVTDGIDINAIFGLNTYTITAKAGPNGTISPSEAVEVPHGSDKTFTITPNHGYSIGEVLIDDVAQELNNTQAYSYTFHDVFSAHAISSTFIERDRTFVGDVNHDGKIDLIDLILALQINTGVLPSQNIFIDADANDNGKIGVEEAVFILKELSK